MERFFEFAAILPTATSSGKMKYGNFMVVLLTGTIAGTVFSPGASNLRLAGLHGQVTSGEMSLLDSGIRFQPATLTDCEIAVLERRGHGRHDDQGTRNWPPA